MFSYSIYWLIIVLLSSVIPEETYALEFHISYRPDLRQAVFIRDEFHYLNAPTVGTYTVSDIFDCTFACLSHPFCLSLNLASYKGADGKLWCELLSSANCSNPEAYKGNGSSHRFSIKTPCLSSPCQNGGTCVADFQDHTFECHCRKGFIGEYCETAGKSCNELYDLYQSSGSQLVTLSLNSGLTSVLCQMGDFGCGNGGWTPVMKIDGHKATFHYNSALWSNQATLNPAGGETGFDAQETKLPTYWDTPFSKICLGMKVGLKQIRFVVIQRQASSLFELIADGQYRATYLGRDTWKTLIGSQGSLQWNCNKEGFNVASSYQPHAKARIGILGNGEHDCGTCDSRIGFGTGGRHDDSSTCGNEARNWADNGDKHIKSMEYILVQ